ncbi:hypothetical protein ACJX0J_039977, partial [Zea mays]
QERHARTEMMLCMYVCMCIFVFLYICVWHAGDKTYAYVAEGFENLLDWNDVMNATTIWQRKRIDLWSHTGELYENEKFSLIKECFENTLSLNQSVEAFSYVIKVTNCLSIVLI